MVDMHGYGSFRTLRSSVFGSSEGADLKGFDFYGKEGDACPWGFQYGKECGIIQTFFERRGGSVISPLELGEEVMISVYSSSNSAFR